MQIKFSKRAEKAISRMDSANKSRMRSGIRKIIKRFLPDDVATTEDLAHIAKAREEYRQGEAISEEAINWD